VATGPLIKKISTDGGQASPAELPHKETQCIQALTNFGCNEECAATNEFAAENHLSLQK
jgi:hypothetical protein